MPRVHSLWRICAGCVQVAGSFVGAVADNLGRRRMCVVYAVFYAISCLVKLSTNYYILMVSGREEPRSSTPRQARHGGPVDRGVMITRGGEFRLDRKRQKLSAGHRNSRD